MPKAETNVEPYGTNQHLGLVCRSGTQPLLRLINRKRGSAPHVSFRFLVKTIGKPPLVLWGAPFGHVIRSSRHGATARAGPGSRYVLDKIQPKKRLV